MLQHEHGFSGGHEQPLQNLSGDSLQMVANEYLSLALDIGERMLQYGAEVNRVEDTIQRICAAYGAKRVDVFTITSSIVVTVFSETSGTITQTRRVTGMQYNLFRLDLLNQLSRHICATLPGGKEIRRRLLTIEQTKCYSFGQRLGIYALVSSSFTVFFGGTALEALASAVIGVLICFLQLPLQRGEFHRIVPLLLLSLFGGVLSHVAVLVGCGQSAALISIGNIMLLIPGIALVNSVRDMVQGDIISGLARFCEAVMLSIIVALGFTMASAMF